MEQLTAIIYFTISAASFLYFRYMREDLAALKALTWPISLTILMVARRPRNEHTSDDSPNNPIRDVPRYGLIDQPKPDE